MQKSIFLYFFAAIIFFELIFPRFIVEIHVGRLYFGVVRLGFFLSIAYRNFPYYLPFAMERCKRAMALDCCLLAAIVDNAKWVQNNEQKETDC